MKGTSLSMQCPQTLISAKRLEGSGCARLVTLSVCLSLCVSLFYFAPFSGLKLTSVHSRDLSPLNVALFFKSKLFWRKSEWNFDRNCSDLRGHRPVMSLNGLARDLLARGTLYQTCHSHCSCVGFFLRVVLYGCGLAECFPFQHIVS